MGYYQEAYDAECVAIERALTEAAEKVQTYALKARKAIAALREREPTVEMEIRWCPAHKGILPDGCAKRAASEPDAHGVE